MAKKELYSSVSDVDIIQNVEELLKPEVNLPVIFLVNLLKKLLKHFLSLENKYLANI